MASDFVQFCTTWIGADPRWPRIIVVLLMILVLVGPRKMITIRKTGKNKWTIIFK